MCWPSGRNVGLGRRGDDVPLAVAARFLELRAKRHTDEQGRYVQPNRLHILEVSTAGNAERLEQMVASGNWTQVPDGTTLLRDPDD